MSRKSVVGVMSFLTVLNVLCFVLALSTTSRAAPSGKNAEALAKDPAFAKAVVAIVQACKINLDLAKLECP